MHIPLSLFVIADVKMEYASDLDRALEMAGPGSKTVIPDDVSVCIAKQGSVC